MINLNKTTLKFAIGMLKDVSKKAHENEERFDYILEYLERGFGDEIPNKYECPGMFSRSDANKSGDRVNYLMPDKNSHNLDCLTEEFYTPEPFIYRDEESAEFKGKINIPRPKLGLCADLLIDSLLNNVKEDSNPNGKTDYYNKDYRRIRHEVFIEQGERCQCCGAKPPTYLQIDHIKPVSKFPELFLDKDNMQVLCQECNQKKSNKHCTDYR